MAFIFNDENAKQEIATGKAIVIDFWAAKFLWEVFAESVIGVVDAHYDAWAYGAFLN